jgi:hypothetical protein
MPAIAALMDKWMAKGYGRQDWMVMGKDLG